MANEFVFFSFHSFAFIFMIVCYTSIYAFLWICLVLCCPFKFESLHLYLCDFKCFLNISLLILFFLFTYDFCYCNSVERCDLRYQNYMYAMHASI